MDTFTKIKYVEESGDYGIDLALATSPAESDATPAVAAEPIAVVPSSDTPTASEPTSAKTETKPDYSKYVPLAFWFNSGPDMLQTQRYMRESFAQTAWVSLATLHKIYWDSHNHLAGVALTNQTASIVAENRRRCGNFHVFERCRNVLDKILSNDQMAAVYQNFNKTIKQLNPWRLRDYLNQPASAWMNHVIVETDAYMLGELGLLRSTCRPEPIVAEMRAVIPNYTADYIADMVANSAVWNLSL